MIQVGTGGFGATWCREFLPPAVADGRIEVVAAVDVDPGALANATRHLGLPPERCYTSVAQAFEERPADFCTIVVPPAAHEGVVDLAIEHDLDILSEKPIADSVEAAVRIADKVRRAGRKMGVTMSHRFDQDKTTLREELRSGRHGRIGYVVLRLTCNCRSYGSWGMFRHEIPDPLLVEAAVHHLDILADLVGDDCELIFADAWNPPWGEYAGPSQALVTMRFRGGGRALYEGAKANAVGLNGWTEEYVRAECELGTLVLDHRRVELFPHDPDGPWAAAREGAGRPLPLLKRPRWAHAWLIEQFVDWRAARRWPPTSTTTCARWC
jgi:predicted dehydrogenase